MAIGDKIILASKSYVDDRLSHVNPAPQITIADEVHENGTVIGSINDYDMHMRYTVTAGTGTITMSGNTFQYKAMNIEDGVNHTDTIEISGRVGTVVTETGTKAITIVYVPMTGDGMISNIDYAGNAEENDGFEY